MLFDEARYLGSCLVVTYIITEPCIDVKYKSCVDVCPVDSTMVLAQRAFDRSMLESICERCSELVLAVTEGGSVEGACDRRQWTRRHAFSVAPGAAATLVAYRCTSRLVQG